MRQKTKLARVFRIYGLKYKEEDYVGLGYLE